MHQDIEDAPAPELPTTVLGIVGTWMRCNFPSDNSEAPRYVVDLIFQGRRDDGVCVRATHYREPASEYWIVSVDVDTEDGRFSLGQASAATLNDAAIAMRGVIARIIAKHELIASLLRAA